MANNTDEANKLPSDAFFNPTLQLILKGINLPTPSYFKIYQNSSLSGSNWILASATEVNSTEPHPTYKDLKFQHNFSIEQTISIELWTLSIEGNNLYGTAKFNIAQLLRAPMKYLELQLELNQKNENAKQPSLKVSIDEPLESKDVLSMTFGAKFTKKFMFPPKMYFSLWKRIEESDFVRVLQSPQVSGKNPSWPQIKVKVSNQFKQFGVLRIVIHESSDRILGHSEFAYPDLIESHKKSFNLVKFESKKNKITEVVDQGTIELLDYHLEKAMTFTEYYTAGLELQYYPVIDFSPFGRGSPLLKGNGVADNTLPDKYKATIKLVSNILQSYVGEKNITAFGIGSNHSNSQNRNYFPVKEEKQLSVPDYKSLLNAFDNTLKKLEDKTSIRLIPVIREILKSIKTDMMLSHKIKYYVCVFYLVGEIEDLRDVIDQIVIASYGVPISFLMLEVGEKSANQLKHLHNSEEHLKDSQNRYLNRLNVKFVNLAEHNSDAHAISKLLEDIPKHIWTLFHKLEIIPNNFSSNDVYEKYLKLGNLISTDLADGEDSYQSFSTSDSSKGHQSFSKSKAMSVFD